MTTNHTTHMGPPEALKRRTIATAAAIFTTASLLGTTPGVTVHQAEAAPPDVRILMIGTSYSNGVKQIMKKIFKAQGVKARIAGKLRAKMRL